MKTIAQLNVDFAVVDVVVPPKVKLLSRSTLRLLGKLEWSGRITA